MFDSERHSAPVTACMVWPPRCCALPPTRLPRMMPRPAAHPPPAFPCLPCAAAAHSEAAGGPAGPAGAPAPVPRNLGHHPGHAGHAGLLRGAQQSLPARQQGAPPRPARAHTPRAGGHRPLLAAFAAGLPQALLRSAWLPPSPLSQDLSADVPLCLTLTLPCPQLSLAGAWLALGLASSGLYFLYLTTSADPGFIPLHPVGGGTAKAVPLQRWDSNGKQQHGRASPSGGGGSGRGGHALLDNPALAAGHWSQLCVACRIVRPLRAKHCPVTGRCVEVFDHYCPWVSAARARCSAAACNPQQHAGHAAACAAGALAAGAACECGSVPARLHSSCAGRGRLLRLLPAASRASACLSLQARGWLPALAAGGQRHRPRQPPPLPHLPVAGAGRHPGVHPGGGGAHPRGGLPQQQAGGAWGRQGGAGAARQVAGRGSAAPVYG
jgi:hypothetical protein